MNIQQIIDKAEQIAVGVGGDPHHSPVIDSEMTAEDLLPLVIRFVFKKMLRDGELGVKDATQSFPISLIEVDGGYEGDIPDNIFIEHLQYSFLPEHPYSSLLLHLPYYQRKRYDNLICYFCIDNGKFYTNCGYTEESSEESEESSEEITITLSAPGIPAMPVNASTDIAMPANATDNVIAILASVLKGELKIADLSSN